MKKLFFVYFILIGLYSFSQNKIKLMSYNLLNFNNYTSYCTNENNSYVAKAIYLKTIVKNQDLDLLAVCEVGTNPTATYTLNYILGNSLNVDGQTKWSVTNTSGSYLVNGLFYDKNKFEYIGHDLVSSQGLRDINIYKLKYIENNEDILMNVVVLHLAAGSSAESVASRGVMIENLMTRIQNIGNNENFVVVGDFNVYSPSEPAFQKLINPSYSAIAFYDPINQIGEWSNNYSFREYHTQSTHSDNNGCHSYGGMDDRFDFILISGSIKDGNARIKYKTNSYWALGQDGLRFNQSLTSPINRTLPDEVIEALYYMSDHLPVVAEFYMGEHNSSVSLSTDPLFYANVVNPFKDELIIKFQTVYSTKTIKMKLMNIAGSLVFEDFIDVVPNEMYYYNLKGIRPGLYILNFSSEGIYQSIRVVKSE